MSFYKSGFKGTRTVVAFITSITLIRFPSMLTMSKIVFYAGNGSNTGESKIVAGEVFEILACLFIYLVSNCHVIIYVF